MSRGRYYRVRIRGLVAPRAVSALRALCEPTEDPVWLSTSCCCHRFTLRGIPARRIDVAIDRRADDPPAGFVWVGEIGDKVGKFDGAIRPRVVVRLAGRKDLAGMASSGDLPVLDLIVREDEESTHVVLGEERWTFRRLRWQPDTETDSGARILTWHWQRYYSHLAWDEASALADTFAIAPGETLAAANRRASRALYELSRDLGWRKLTCRERRKYGIDGEAQWHREEWIAERIGQRPDVSEHTLMEATGLVPLAAAVIADECEAI
jgi:hypothetical protein